MPIDQATLDRYISDVAGDDKELADMLREKLGSKQDAATRFVGGFLARADYTTKTQELARQRQQFESAQQDYEQRLTQAEAEKDQIMKDLANERITAAKAQSLLKTVKQAYQLTDNDLPGIEDIKETVRTGQVVDSTPNLDERLSKFEQQIMDKITKQLVPEISGLAMLGPVWNEIGHEHERLFGQRLSKKDQAEILKQAREENRSLESVWQDKYNVSEKRLEVRDKELEAKLRRQWEDEQAKKNQEAALRGVNPEAREFVSQDMQSPLFKRSFMPQEQQNGNGNNGTNGGNFDRNVAPANNDAARERMGAADRAAAKFLERKANGQLGKPLAETRVPA
jgi:cell division protein ZapA (FtsZ GTPase activity inhibitor)